MAKERKVLPIDYARSAEGIIKRMASEDIALLLLFRAKKDYAMHYLQKGELHSEGPSAIQLVTSLYHGEEYEYGPADNRQKMYLEPNPSLVEEMERKVPEEEKKLATTTRVSASQKAVNDALLTAAKNMLNQNFTVSQIAMFLGLSVDQIETLKEPVEQVETQQVESEENLF